MMYEMIGTWKFGSKLCDIWVFFHQTSFIAATINLCALSIDRYLSIKRPLQYTSERTPCKIIIGIILCWLIATTVSVPPLIFGNNYIDDQNQPICLVYESIGYQIYWILIGFFIPFTIMMFTYYKVFAAARRIWEYEERTQNYLEQILNGTNDTISQMSDISTVFRSGKQLRKKLATHYKATAILGFLVFAFGACALPFYVLLLGRLSIEGENRSLNVVNKVSLLFLWLSFLNSVLDPIINASMHQEFREPIIEILHCRWSQVNVVIRAQIRERMSI